MPNSNRGFAAMEPEEQRRIASKGGRAAHESGHAHEWNSGEAAEAGRRGGLASHGERAAFHHDSAAHHHAQAARYRASGEHDRADLHAEHARHHGREGDEARDRARTSASASNRGFASMDQERQREIASDGGRASRGGRSNESEGGHEEDLARLGGDGEGSE